VSLSEVVLADRPAAGAGFGSGQFLPESFVSSPSSALAELLLLPGLVLAVLDDELLCATGAPPSEEHAASRQSAARTATTRARAMSRRA
jgi:hypothetical protein